MRKLREIFLLLSGLLLTACQKPLFNNVPSSLRASPRQQTRASTLARDSTEAEPGMPDIFATALSFPTGGSPQVLLFKNGKRILTVEGSEEPQRHRYKAGHLWTDFSDGTRTVLCRDGQEYCRFEGEELFMGFTVADGQVHSLGQRQGRDGFCYRTDGKEVFSSPSGTLLGTPWEQDWADGAFSEQLHYSYGIPVWKGSELLWEYHLMRGAEAVKTFPVSQAEQVYDIRYYQGAVYRSELRSGGSLCLVKDETVQQILSAVSGNTHLCKLHPQEGEMLVRGYSYLRGLYTFWLRDMGGIRYSATSSNLYYGLYVDAGVQAQVLLGPDNSVTSILKNKVRLPITSGTYTFRTPLCCDFRHGVFAAALSAKNGGEHVLLTNERLDTVRFNGYFTSLQIQ
ncbi:MAG: hypothetical protein J6M31_06650 [Bacteroidales bacterium]|nr:hypothetical protein [Bacteroidales bacterium]